LGSLAKRENPGELLHIDIKKPGSLDQVGHRIPGDRTQCGRNVGGEYVFVAVDDHSRWAFTPVYPDETKISVEAFLRSAVATSPACVCRSSACSPTTACRSDPSCSVSRAWSWASPRSSPGLTARRPMERPRGSFSLRCASGPLDTPTSTHSNAVRPCRSGLTTTTGIGPTTALTWCHLSRVFRPLERTS
jgi:hypothetical protein